MVRAFGPSCTKDRELSDGIVVTRADSTPSNPNTRSSVADGVVDQVPVAQQQHLLAGMWSKRSATWRPYIPSPW